MPIAIAALVLVVVIAGQQHASPAPAANALPATPRAWVDKWTAASLEHMGRVCQQLFSPALAAADKADTVHNCTSNHHSTSRSPLRVERILQDGPTATIEAHKAGAASKVGLFHDRAQPYSERLAGRRRRPRWHRPTAVSAIGARSRELEMPRRGSAG